MITTIYTRILKKLQKINDKKEAEASLATYHIESDRLKSKFDSLSSPKKIHFGCGPRILKGWINIDLFFEPYEQYMGSYTNIFYGDEIRGERDEFYAIDITKVGIPLADNSVDLIFHEDFIEHLTEKEQIIFLAETLRVLKPTGIHRINTPDLTKAMNKSDFSKGKLGVYEEEWTKHGHFNILTKVNMSELAHMVGYSDIQFNKRNQSASKLIPNEYRPAPDRPEDGNIFADLIK